MDDATGEGRTPDPDLAEPGVDEDSLVCHARLSKVEAVEFEEKSTTLRLGDFILENMEAILVAWEDFARSFWPGPLPGSATLRNDAEAMLRAVVTDMGSSQTQAQQKAKSEGDDEAQGREVNRAALDHALARVDDGLDVARMVAEFRALRASVSRLWWESVPAPHKEQIDDMGRFNEALDLLVATSVAGFTERVDRSRRLFLGILGHDLRQPIFSIQMFIDILAKPDSLPAGNERILSSMRRCCDSVTEMLSDLLDFTSTQLGSAMPVYPAASNMEVICREVLEEVQATAPSRSFNLETAGDLDGEWDASRMRQVISNLLSNAMQHGLADEPINVTLRGSEGEVTLGVHNMGSPIPPESMGILFDPMVRLAAGEAARPHGSIGLGLYISRQVAIAHGGKIKVESSPESGTTFTVILPKRFVNSDRGSR